MLKLEQEIVVSCTRRVSGTHVLPKDWVVYILKTDRILKHINFKLVDSIHSATDVSCVLNKKKTVTTTKGGKNAHVKD